MQEGAKEYFEDGIPPCGFLYKVLINNLTRAFGHADDINLNYMFEWASFLYNEAPRSSWGSEQDVKKWIERGGINGQKEPPRPEDQGGSI